MGQRNIWEDIYALEIFPSTVALSSLVGTAVTPVFAGTSTTGVRGITGTSGTTFTNVFYNLLPTEHPNPKQNAGQVEKTLATGKSLDNSVTITPVTVKPENFTVPLVFNVHNMGNLALLFFQNGVSYTNNAGTSVLTVTPYTDSQPIRFGNVVRFMQDTGESDLVDQFLQGVIVKKMSIKGEEGGIIEGDVEFMPGAFVQGSFAGTANQALTKCKAFDSTRPLRFEEVTFEMGSLPAGASEGSYVTVSVPNFELTFENNAFTHFYNSNVAKVISMGKFSFEGSITVPWNDASAQGKNQQILDYKNGVTKQIRITFDSGTAPSKVVLTFSAKISDYTQTDKDGLPMLETKFRLIEDNINTNSIFPFTGVFTADATKQVWR